jgi:hypothetical protein
MPPINDRFAEVIKSKRTVVALQNAVDTELARLKIEADAISRTIHANILTLESAKDHESLFPDFKAICTKAPDDFTALVSMRISQHKAAQEAKATKIKEAAELAAQVRAAQPIIESAAQHVSTAISDAVPSQEGVGQGENAVAAAPTRDELVRCVLMGNGMKLSWCKRTINDFQKAFMDPTHAALNGISEGRLVACPECVAEIHKALTHGHTKE